MRMPALALKRKQWSITRIGRPRPSSRRYRGEERTRMSETGCVFCAVVAALEEADTCPAGDDGHVLRKVQDLPASVAILAPDQYYRGYTLVVSKTHATELYELPDRERAQYFNDMLRVARAIAAAFRPRKMTYGQFAAMSRSLAAALDDLGVADGERVAIISPNAARFLVSLFGVSVYGRVIVPVNFRLNAEEVRYIVEHSGSTVALIDPELDESLQELKVKHRFVLGTATDQQLFLRKNAAPRGRVTDENATVSINYTSGTTARPKGVQLTHRGCWLNAVTFGWHLGLSDRDVYLHTLPTFHCNGWGMPYAVTAIGARQVIIRKIEGEEILTRVEQEGVTIFNCAPAVIASVLDAAAARRHRGRSVPGKGRVRVVVAGAPPPSRTIERIESELGWEFIQIYGLTETSPLLTFNRAPCEWDAVDPAERARRLSRAGVPAVGVRMRVDP